MNRTGAQMISDERSRQKETEGYDADHDKGNTPLQLLDAGLCYGVDLSSHMDPGALNDASVPAPWPWEKKFWKPTHANPIKQMVKVGALIAAAIDRLQDENGESEE